MIYKINVEHEDNLILDEMPPNSDYQMTNDNNMIIVIIVFVSHESIPFID